MLALLVSFVAYDLSFLKAMGVGHAAFGGWGLVAAIVVLGFGLAVVFTTVFDGPVALGRLLNRENRSYRGQR